MILEGISRYARGQGAWRFTNIRPDDYNATFSLPDAWQGHGVIGYFAPRDVQAVHACGLPAVNVSNSPRLGLPLPGIVLNNANIGSLAARHLVDRGFNQYAYVGLPHKASQTRCRGFADTLNKQGRFLPENMKWWIESHQGDPVARREYLMNKLLDSPRPLGVFAMDDFIAEFVMDAARAARLDIPDDVAVVGSGNREGVCGLADPPLSSVHVNASKVGYRSLQLLESLLDDNTRWCSCIVDPAEVVARQSTDILAIDDPTLQAATSYINREATEPISVDDVVAQTSISRRNLEQRFANSLGQSIHEKIHNVRTERAIHLLVTTDQPLVEIAVNSGLGSASNLCRVIKYQTGLTPTTLRQQRGTVH